MSEDAKTISRKTGAKVTTAVFGQDLFVELKDYPLSKAGNKIDISKSGGNYFQPEIGPNHFLYWPRRKKYFLFGPWIYQPIYFVLKRGSKCIDFSLNEPKAYGPDIEQIDSALGNNLASQIGADINKGVHPIFYLMFMVLLVVLGLTLRVAGVIS